MFKFLHRPLSQAARRGSFDRLVKPTSLSRVMCAARIHSDERRGQTPSAATESKPYLENLRKRELYNDEFYRDVVVPDIKSLDIVQDGDAVEIVWADGRKSRFLAIWLRHSCHCEVCRMDYNGMVDMDFASVDHNIKVTSAYLEGNEVLVLKYASENGEKYHEGPIPTNWLRHFCTSEEAAKLRHQQREMKFYDDTVIPEIEYEEVVASDAGLYKWVKTISERGIVLMKNVPLEDGMVAKMAEKISPVQHSLYGEIQYIIATPEPINPGLSAHKLDYHSDQIHYESPVGLQLFHCMDFAPEVEGGINNFVDIHQIAHQMRKERPDLFDVLTKVPALIRTVHYNRPVPIHIEIERPLIILNHKKELMSVTWNEYMLGPLLTDEKDIKPFYEAHSYLHKMISSWPSYEHRLQPGDLITVNNRRVMHSRSAFINPQNVRRELQVCYVEISEFQSKVQILHNKLGDGRLAMRCGSSNFQ